MRLTEAQEMLRWAQATFGDVALDRVERALRFTEEAMEAAHAAGVPMYQLYAMVERVYTRPAGQLPREIAQAGMTLVCFAANECIDLDDAISAEYARVLEIPAVEMQKRHAAKAAQGILSTPHAEPMSMLRGIKELGRADVEKVDIWQEPAGWTFGLYPHYRLSGFFTEERFAIASAERRGFIVGRRIETDPPPQSTNGGQ